MFFSVLLYILAKQPPPHPLPSYHATFTLHKFTFPGLSSKLWSFDPTVLLTFTCRFFRSLNSTCTMPNSSSSLILVDLCFISQWLLLPIHSVTHTRNLGIILETASSLSVQIHSQVMSVLPFLMSPESVLSPLPCHHHPVKLLLSRFWTTTWPFYWPRLINSSLCVGFLQQKFIGFLFAFKKNKIRQTGSLTWTTRSCIVCHIYFPSPA